MKSNFQSTLLLLGMTPLATALSGGNYGGKRHLEVHSHRGGMAMQVESSLWAFAYGMETGADYLEMDIVFTKDGVPVVWHDHKIQEAKCSGEHIGEFVANITLEQVKTLNCNKQIEDYPQAEVHEIARIQTLEEVLDFIDCYGDRKVNLNMETKLNPLKPEETLEVDWYVNDIVPILERRGYAKRTVIQSFDWRTLIRIKEKFPEMGLSALIDAKKTVPEDDGTYPWLGGLSLEDFDGDWVAAAASIGATVLSPSHGGPSSATVNTPGYKEFSTKDVVKRAHDLGMSLVAGTVDDEVTLAKLIDDGVDGIITNYPQRLMWVAKEKHVSSGIGKKRRRVHCLPRE